MSTQTTKIAAPQQATSTIRGLRWYICALLFFSTTINYIDRQVFSILAPDLQRSIGWNEVEYGYIVTAFQAAYAGGYFIVGRIMDSIPTRKGFAIILGVWSLAAMAHAAARSAFGFGIARAALRTRRSRKLSRPPSRQWRSGFPSRNALSLPAYSMPDRISARSLRLSSCHGSRINYGWQWAFIITGGLGFVWLIFWLWIYRRPEEHQRLSPSEFEHIRSDPPEKTERVAWAKVFPKRADVGVRDRQVSDGPGLVVFSLLAAEVPQPAVRTHARQDGPAAGRHLCGGGHRQHRRWLAFLDSDQTRLDHQRGAEDRDARLRALRRADRLCREGIEPMGGGRAGEPGHVGAPGLVGEPLYDHVGYVPAKCGRVGNRYRRNAWALGGMFVATAAGYILQITGQLLLAIRDRRFDVSNRFGDHSFARAASGTG